MWPRIGADIGGEAALWLVAGLPALADENDLGPRKLPSPTTSLHPPPTYNPQALITHSAQHVCASNSRAR